MKQLGRFFLLALATRKSTYMDSQKGTLVHSCICINILNTDVADRQVNKCYVQEIAKEFNLRGVASLLMGQMQGNIFGRFKYLHFCASTCLHFKISIIQNLKFKFKYKKPNNQILPIIFSMHTKNYSYSTLFWSTSTLAKCSDLDNFCLLVVNSCCCWLVATNSILGATVEFRLLFCLVKSVYLNISERVLGEI